MAAVQRYDGFDDGKPESGASGRVCTGLVRIPLKMTGVSDGS